MCIVCFTVFQKVFAQELQCEVSINDKQVISSQVGASNRESVVALQKNITDFMNNKRWADSNVEPSEKIVCRIQINLIRADYASGSYEANAQIQAFRTAYNSQYESLLFTYVDRKFNFNYLVTQPLDLNFNENIYFSNLSSTLGYYALLILALDRDSFTKAGGNSFIDKAFIVATTAQSAGADGWTQGDIRDRFWMVENLQSQQMLGVREGLYKYYRKGLDMYQERRTDAQVATIELLREVARVALVKPNSLFFNVLFDAKSQEFVNILKDAKREDKQEAHSILSRLDPSRAAFYSVLIAN